MKVKILSGAYGHKPKGSLIIHPVYQGGICDVDPEEAARLVKIGAAEYAEGGQEQPSVDEEEPPEASPIGETSEEEKAEETPFTAPELDDMSFDELKALAKELDVDTKGLRSKQALREALAAAMDEDVHSDELPPELSAAEVI